MQNRAFSLAYMETWKAIPGYEGRYEVSDIGRVRSLDRYVECEGPIKGKYLSKKKGRVLRPGPSNFGHLSVVLGRNNTQFVHKLVLLAFVGPAPDKHECCHNNGDPADNRLENLRWGTRSENNTDAVVHHNRGKLSESDIQDIRRSLAVEGRGIGRKLASKYGVHETTISAIKVRRHYACFVV
jgi:hypothetical protein